MDMRFTPEQQAAIDADNAELLVCAAAGSGKTAVLVRRILRLLAKRGLSVDRLLVVTFTRAAASELRERLELLLTEEAERDPRMLKQLELLPNAQISTIHGYCTQLLREHFQRCALDPQFTICDAATRERLFVQSLENTLDRLYTLAKTNEGVAALCAKWQDREIAEMIPPLYDFLLSRPDPFPWFEACANADWDAGTMDGTPLAALIMKEARLTCDCAEAVWAEAKEISEEAAFPPPLQKTVAADGRALSALREAANGALTGLARALADLKFETLARAKPQDEAGMELAEEFKQDRERYKALAGDLKKLFPGPLDACAADLTAMRPAMRGLYEAVRLFHEDFQAAKRELSQVDFTDLEHMTLAVLGDARLREAESARFDAVLVDEYQDVSEIQEAILNALKREGGGQTFFYVGDVKQSIYRFRLAEPKLFLRKQREFSQDAGAPRRVIALNRNFRSRSGVLAAVNRVFSHVMDARVTEIDYDADARLVPGSPSVGDPATELHFLDTEGRSPQEKILAEACFIAEDIARLVDTPKRAPNGEPDGAWRYRDIAVLLPVSKNVADKVELALRSRGIPVYCENAADSMRSEEITQAVQHLKLMDNLMDDLSLVSELRSPLFEMSESELCRVRLAKPQKEASFLDALREAAESGADEALRARCREALALLERERFLLHSMALDEYLWDFLQRSGLYAHYGAQPGGKLRQANLQMLCSLASDYEQSRGDGLRGFLDSLGTNLELSGGLSPTVVNPWENVVRVMTIHKSKGLEFPALYVMGLGGALRRRGQSARVGYHADLGVALQYVNERAHTKRKTLLQQGIDLARRGEDTAERARLLYVAMTRAKSRLTLVGSMSRDDFGYEDALALRRNGFDGGGVAAVRAAGSMLDWLAQSIRPWDAVEERDFSTIPMRKKQGETAFPTGFPQDDPPWRVVFHIQPAIATVSRPGRARAVDFPLLPNKELAPAVPAREAETGGEAYADPVAPELRLTHAPLKLGVTALARAQGDAARAADDEETPQTKRMAFLPQTPTLMDAVPLAPAFLAPTREEAPLRRGTATHKLLCMIDLDGARAVAPGGMADFARAELARLAGEGIFTPEEARDADAALAARFLGSDMGARMLASAEVHREWRFNLRVHEPFDTIAQGVIDLCFVENGAWVLVDFKTDRVDDERALSARYAMQLGLYRAALEKATGRAVGECALFSLTLGRTVRQPSADAPNLIL